MLEFINAAPAVCDERIEPTTNDLLRDDYDALPNKKIFFTTDSSNITG